jgi:DNA-binding NtrC family response regulator
MRQPQGNLRSIEGKIFLVDEDAQKLNDHLQILRRRGLQVVVRSSHSAAAPLLERNDFDLVVVSQGAPFFEGWCVLERAKQVAPRTPDLILTNYADMGVYLEAMDLGATDYLEKAVDPSEIIRVIDGILTSPRAARAGGASQSAALDPGP